MSLGHQIHVTKPDGSTAFACNDAPLYMLIAVRPDGHADVSSAIHGPQDALKMLSTLLGATVIGPLVQHAVRSELARMIEEDAKPKIVTATSVPSMPPLNGG